MRSPDLTVPQLSAASGGKTAANLAALFAIQGGNALFPLILYPYLLIVLGAHRFADIAWTEALNLIVLNVVLYSFDVDGMRRLINANGIEDAVARSRVFYSVLWARLCLLVVCSVSVLGFVGTLDPSALVLSASWLLVVVGQTLQSSWFYLASEQNVPVAVATLMARILTVAAIFMIVRNSRQYALVPLFCGASYVASGAPSFLYAVRRYRITFQRPTLRNIWFYVHSGRAVFAGNISVVLFRGANIILLKLLSLDTAVAVYTLAEKAVKCAQAAVRPMNQFAYPRLVRELHAHTLRHRGCYGLIMTHTRIQLAMVVAFWCAAYICWLVYTAIGYPYPTFGNDVAKIIAIMAPAVFFGVCNYMFGTIGLTNLGKGSKYARAVLVGGMASLIASLALIPTYGALGAAIGFVVGEVVLFTVVLWHLRSAGAAHGAPS